MARIRPGVTFSGVPRGTTPAYASRAVSSSRNTPLSFGPLANANQFASPRPQHERRSTCNTMSVHGHLGACSYLAIHTGFLDFQVVPRETSCILRVALLAFRLRGNIWLELSRLLTKKAAWARQPLQ